jgi:transposase InsO family protein
MSWKVEKPMDQKVKMIGEWLSDNWSISDLSKKYSVSRKTIHKWINRYSLSGIKGLEDKKRIPLNSPYKTSEEVIQKIISVKVFHRTWGPKKIIYRLKKLNPEQSWPAASTAARWLDRNNLVIPRKRRTRSKPYTEPFIDCTAPNDIWSIDYKGQFFMKNHKKCYPLTISDNFSRYLLECVALEGPRYKETKAVLERLFIEYGLPLAIRSDNGTPFAGLGVGGLSTLSIWWIKLGIIPERIDLGAPQQNGRHERMHRTLKADSLNPVGNNISVQQNIFDKFKYIYNNERPHEALAMKTPHDAYFKSKRQYPSQIKPIIYDHGWEVRRIKNNGDMKLGGKRFFISQLLYREPVGLKEIADGIWQINFSFHKLGYIDLHRNKVIRYYKKVLPMSQV